MPRRATGRVNRRTRGGGQPRWTCCHESIETTQVYLDADLELMQKILDKTTPPTGKLGRYRPDDKLLAFLKGL
jgi:hypothetical protein